MDSNAKTGLIVFVFAAFAFLMHGGYLDSILSSIAGRPVSAAKVSYIRGNKLYI